MQYRLHAEASPLELEVTNATVKLANFKLKAVEKGDGEEYQQIEKQLVSERKKFQAELEEKKDAVRNAGKANRYEL